MAAGTDRVIGERWLFDHEHIETVLKTLDQIEGTNQPGHDDLYQRVVVEIWTPDDHLIGQAWAYHYATDPRVDRFVRIEPGQTGSVAWP